MYFYIGTIYAAAMLFLVNAVILFMRRKQGERSRMILFVLQLMSVFNYTARIIAVNAGETPTPVLTTPMLILGIFMACTYPVYPIEVISPGWLNFRRVILCCTPVAFIYLIYQISLWIGVEYPPYESILDMLPHIGNFDVLFRLSLCLLIFLPPFLLLLLPYTKRYNNTDAKWIRTYIIIAVLKATSYTTVLMFDNIWVDSSYYYVSALTSVCLVYLEVFERIIPPKPAIKTVSVKEHISSSPSPCSFSKDQPELFTKLVDYVMEHELWKDPELSLDMLVRGLNSNRTSLWKAIINSGHSNYNQFIASIRIDEYIKIIRNHPNRSYMTTFYEVGYRSKATACRNFRMITGTTPTEYFQREDEPSIEAENCESKQ